MKLLVAAAPSELPTEALLARLRGRRAALRADDDFPAEAVTGWIYRRLNNRLRRDLTPCLDLLALRTLIVSLRHALAGEAPPEALQRDGLLAAPLHRLTGAAYSSETLMAKLEEALGGDYPFAKGLAGIHRQQGPGGVEQRLVLGLLQHGLARSRNHVVCWLLGSVIDLRNGLAIMKHWQWQIATPPVFAHGGTLTTDLLLRTFSGGNRERLAHMLGTPGATRHTAALEQALLAKLTGRLRQAARDPLGLAVVLESLWCAQLALHNRALRRNPAARGETLLL